MIDKTNKQIEIGRKFENKNSQSSKSIAQVLTIYIIKASHINYTFSGHSIQTALLLFANNAVQYV